MSEEKKKERVTRTVSFTAAEDALIQKRAEEAGMTVAAYIRQQALGRTVQYIDWEALRAHGDIIGDIAMNLEGVLQNLTDIDRHTSVYEIGILKRDMRTIVKLERDMLGYILPDVEV